MTALRIYFGAQAGDTFRRSIYRQADLVREAMRAAAVDAVTEIRKRGAQDIAGAGKFGSRWTEGIQGQVTEGGGNIRVEISHDEPLFPVFEFGKTIQGNPLLWIPLSVDFGGQADAQGVYASAYPRPLFRVDRPGKAPLLLAFSPASKTQPRGRRGRFVARAPAAVVYFGKPSVTIPKKFHLTEITQDVAVHFGDLYRARRKG